MQPKLRAVIRHEYMTIVKQPTFWLIMLAIPVLIAAIFAISYFSGKASEERINEAAKNIENAAIIDESGLISNVMADNSFPIKRLPASEKDAAIERVKNDQLNGLIIYPENILETRDYKVYVSQNDFTLSSTLSTLGDGLLEAALLAPLGSPQKIALVKQGANANVISFENGRQTAGFMEYIVPGVFLVLFYLVLVFSVNYMLTSVAEEKENRSMEMVLSYVPPRTLILGKLLGIALVTLTQLIFLGLVAVAAYLIALQFQSQLNLPVDIDFSALVFDPLTILIGLVVLVFGFLLFAALMAGVGSMVPSAKDAGGLSFIFIIGAILPFYTFSIISTDPNSPITTFMTFFPTTAPTTLLIRNTFGNLGGLETALAIAALIVFTLLSILLAGKLFRLGALEYTNRLSFKQLLGR